jgi:hypothetical protein
LAKGWTTRNAFQTEEHHVQTDPKSHSACNQWIPGNNNRVHEPLAKFIFCFKTLSSITIFFSLTPATNKSGDGKVYSEN